MAGSRGRADSTAKRPRRKSRGSRPVRADRADRAGRGAERGRLRDSLDRVARAYRDTEKFLARFAPVRMSLALPRTADYVARTWWRGDSEEHPPRPRLSLGLAGKVAMDEAILLGVAGPGRFPRRADYERVGAEMRAQRRFLQDNGWIVHPERYHRSPPPLETPLLLRDRALTGLPFERMSFDSGFEPHRGEPGRERWLGYFPNHISHAWVVRHADDRPRPWLVCIHGFAMGYPTCDFPAFRAGWLHRALGFNLVFPVLPLHGPRKVSKLSGDAFLSFDMQNGILGMANAVWDVRRVLDWVARQEPVMVGLYGISLGGYVTALTAGLADGLDLAIAGVPVTDFPALFAGHSPRHVRERGLEHGALGPAADEVWRVVSPMTFAPKVPHDSRFIYAGLADRMAPPEQAQRLWKHWGEPEISWYPGNHVGFLLTGEISRFVGVALSPWAIRPPADGARAD